MNEKEDGIVEINLSKDVNYYKQGNNKIDPKITCQVTAYINALIGNGYTEDDIMPPEWKGKQPEDYFSTLFSLPDVIAYANGLNPDFDSYIREIHDVLVYTCNKHLIKENVATFSTEVTIQECIDSIVKHKKIFVASGTFCGFGHVVAVVGLKYRPKSNQVISFIIDDPYGDYHTGYESKKGNNIEMPYDDFINMIKNKGKQEKWIHLFVDSSEK